MATKMAKIEKFEYPTNNSNNDDITFIYGILFINEQAAKSSIK